MKTAKFIKDVSENFTGDARLYELSEPVPYDIPFDEEEEETKTTSFVVVSTTSNFLGTETSIFPSDSEGEILDWGELDGSFRGRWDHNEALNIAGYALEVL